MKEITLSSKNQVTIPADIARRLDLHRGSRLKVRVADSSLVMTPQVDLNTRLATVQGRMRSKITKPLSDTDIKRALRNYPK